MTLQRVVLRPVGVGTWANRGCVVRCSAMFGFTSVFGNSAFSIYLFCFALVLVEHVSYAHTGQNTDKCLKK